MSGDPRAIYPPPPHPIKARKNSKLNIQKWYLYLLCVSSQGRRRRRREWKRALEFCIPPLIRFISRQEVSFLFVLLGLMGQQTKQHFHGIIDRCLLLFELEWHVACFGWWANQRVRAPTASYYAWWCFLLPRRKLLFFKRNTTTRWRAHAITS